MRVVVTQIGARRGYAVPSILEKAGMLELLYTDLAGNVGIGKWLVKCGPFLGWKMAAQRLATRRVPNSILAKTITFCGCRSWLCHVGRCCSRNPARRFREQLLQSRLLGSSMIRRGFGKATHLYSMLGECGPVMAAAKRRGLKVITEVYITPSTERTLSMEQANFPDWEPPAADLEAIRNAFSEQANLWSETDFFVCPADGVQRDLELHYGTRAEQSAVVPYGVDAAWLAMPSAPVPGRVLFVGTAGLRKGIHYLAEAASLLGERGRRYEFRIVGDVETQIANRPSCKPLSFIGRVPRNLVRREFTNADIFVLPSLAEGSAESTYEALAAGLPVITTNAAGSVVRQGIDGWIVPERDPIGLANKIEETVEDRVLRDSMSRAAHGRAREYTFERYGERLISALRGFEK